MSKIAKALELAREARLAREAGTRVPAPVPQPKAVEVPEEQQAPHRRFEETLIPTGRDMVEQKSSREIIKRMNEVDLLDKPELEERKIIFPEMTNHKVLNVFRDLRTKLLSVSIRKNFMCLVTSVRPGGGSSFVALNLATAFSFDQSKTSLVIDCNLRDPDPSLPVVGGKYGLTEYLENPDIEPSEIIRATGVKRLRVVPSGGNREIPAEYFSSERMWEFLDHIKERFQDRYIFIDGPPATESADVRILSSLCDLVILVVPYGKVTEAQIEAAAKAFDRSKLVGVVFNDVH